MHESDRDQRRPSLDPVSTLKKTCAELRDLRDAYNARINRMLERCENTLRMLEAQRKGGAL
jgi:hypothetical protein